MMSSESDDNIFADFLSDLEKRDIILSDTLMQMIIEYFDMNLINQFYFFLLKYNQAGGFFSKSDEQRIADRHILESLIHILYLIRTVPVSRETKVLDAGSGPGIPGFLFACLKNPPRLFLMDSSRRRLEYLKNFAEKHLKSSLKNEIRFIFQRAEDHQGNYSLITVRALIPYPHFAELLCHLQKPGDYVAFWAAKIKNSEKEKNYLSLLGYTVDKAEPLKELSFLGDRYLILLKKISATAAGYPRAWKYIKQEISLWEK